MGAESSQNACKEAVIQTFPLYFCLFYIYVFVVMFVNKLHLHINVTFVFY